MLGESTSWSKVYYSPHENSDADQGLPKEFLKVLWETRCSKTDPTAEITIKITTKKNLPRVVSKIKLLLYIESPKWRRR